MAKAASPLLAAASKGISMTPGVISAGAGLGSSALASTLSKAAAPSATSVFGMVDKTGLGKLPSWLTQNKDAMKNAGLSLMQMGMQQQQAQGSPMQLTPFQPSAGGGGMPGGQGGQGALMQLLQQYGMNKIQ
jgi:hypothetical protein